MIYIENLQGMPAKTHHVCIYFLMLDGAVVYVGQSKNYMSRIGKHKTDGKKNFDEFKVVELPYGADADFVEFCEIANRKPVYNYTLPGLDFLLTISDIKEMEQSTQLDFDLNKPDYTIIMPKKVFNYWKMGGFNFYYETLDICLDSENKTSWDEVAAAGKLMDEQAIATSARMAFLPKKE